MSREMSSNGALGLHLPWWDRPLAQPLGSAIWKRESLALSATCVLLEPTALPLGTGPKEISPVTDTEIYVHAHLLQKIGDKLNV